MKKQDEIQKIVAQMRVDRMNSSIQLTLGQLITEIEKCGTKNPRDGSDKSIMYDFGYMKPTHLDSWRGSYAEIAMGYDEKGDYPTAESVLCECKDAIGSTYQGYKGGEFIMGADTPVWVANYGHSGETGIIGILDKGYQLILLTTHCKY